MRHLLSNLCLIGLCLLADAARGQTAGAPAELLPMGAPEASYAAPPSSSTSSTSTGTGATTSSRAQWNLAQKGQGQYFRQQTQPEVLPPSAPAQSAVPGQVVPSPRGALPGPIPVSPPGASAVNPLAAVPAPEPALPRWGNYLDPTSVPVALPAVQYEVVGPPRGIVQHSENQDQTRVINDPSPLLYQDSQMFQAIDLYRPDGLAPAGVFNDHTLVTGRMLISYRYLQTSFDDLYVNSHQVSFASVQAHYTYVPTRMLQDSQVALLEYGLTDDFTFTAMLPWMHNLIDYSSLGGNIATGFTNPGDIRLNGLYVLRRTTQTQQHVNVGVSIPVGLLQDAFNLNPSPTIPNLSYPLRTSSGTYDLLLGYTIRGQSENWTWGAQASGVIRAGINTLDYRLGDYADVTGWLARRWGRFVSTSARLDSQFQGNIAQADARLNPAQAPTNDPNHIGYERLNALFGLNFYLPDGRIPGQRLSVEAGLPIYQSVEGPQLGADWLLNASWNMIF